MNQHREISHQRRRKYLSRLDFSFLITFDHLLSVPGIFLGDSKRTLYVKAINGQYEFNQNQERPTIAY